MKSLLKNNKYLVRQESLRSELFDLSQLEANAEQLAKTHVLLPGNDQKELLKQRDHNEKALLHMRYILSQIPVDVAGDQSGEWFLNNFYILEDQLRKAKQPLAKNYFKKLPSLKGGTGACNARLYNIICTLIAHTDGKIDIGLVTHYLGAYQQHAPLKLAELRALTVIFRFALIENVRRITSRIANARLSYLYATRWISNLLDPAGHGFDNLQDAIQCLAEKDLRQDPVLRAELLRLLKRQGTEGSAILKMLEEQLACGEITCAELINQEIRCRQEYGISLRNNIVSLKNIGTGSWNEFVEKINAVNKVLCKDASGIYPCMDINTRESYRNVVEKIAAYSQLSEIEVSEMLVRITKENMGVPGTDHRTIHIGFYLMEEGLPVILRSAGARLPAREKIRQFISGSPSLIYFGLITLLTIVLGSILLSDLNGLVRKEGFFLAGFLLILCAVQIAITFTDWLSGFIYKGVLLPRMDYVNGIPEEYRTLVIIPALLASEAQCEKLVKELEVRYWGNQDKYLHFGLLTDFTDAPHEVMEGDGILLDFLQTRINELNRKYPCPGNNVFFLFHRPRKYNARDGIWMGEERKRGKIIDLCRLLRQGPGDSFSLILGDRQLLSKIKYVITLDVDTNLPIKAASKMIATLSHPLNHAVYCERKKIITKGYGILQPRMAIEMGDSGKSAYSRIYANAPGIDPYTRVYADLYQDLFRQGSFVGKGIFEVDVFLKVLDRRFPDNRILSHDLLEGCYIRSGLITDVQLFEDHPVSYRNDVKRRHRWIRGDWQIAAWAMPLVPSADNSWKTNPLSGLSRWKIADNLRRSLMPVSYLSILLFSWLFAKDPFPGIALVVFIILLPGILSFSNQFLNQLGFLYKLRRWKAILPGTWKIFQQSLFTMATLPHEALYTADAIMKANIRLYVTRKNMLEWDHPDNTRNAGQQSISQVYRHMSIAPAISLMVLLILAVSMPFVLVESGALLLSWAAAPAIIWWLSRPADPISDTFTPREKKYLRRLARKHWCYFETFVGPDDNWLPPDHYQEYPVKRVVHRTSPTNIGISLLACLAANDFGFITAGQLITRSAKTLDTLDLLERYKGHFYNWYDTQSLKAVSPRYISTVDSGNLTGHLMVFRQGILDLREKKILDASLFEGLYDTLNLLSEEIPGSPLLIRIAATLDHVLNTRELTLTDMKHAVEELAGPASELHSATPKDPDNAVCWWSGLLFQQVNHIREELMLLAPWIILPRHAKILKDLPDIDRIPTLRELKHMEAMAMTAIEKFDFINNDAEQIQLTQLFSVYFCRMTREVNRRWAAIENICRQSSDFSDIELSFLYDKYQKLLFTGYNAEANVLDRGCFETLASETRLSTFVGIADNKLPQESWFTLLKPICHSEGLYSVLSWSGSMFEYLMPLLIMPNYENTVLDIAYRSAVKKQIAYGRLHGVPWGISESACNEFNATLHYQYGPRGLASLGLKRSSGDDLTIAPYASALALMIMPAAACRNLLALSAEGAESKFGFYEAIEYTPARLPDGKNKEMIYSCMVHHQGMSFLAFAYSLLDKPMQKRFLTQPHFQSASLLLQERMATDAVFSPAKNTLSRPVPKGKTGLALDSTKLPPLADIITTWNTKTPEVRLLSNGRYHLMITNAGGTYSRWNDMDITRWREDAACDNRGSFCYIRDLSADTYWSIAHQPALRPADSYEMGYTDGEIYFRRYDGDLETETHITVAQEYDVELRKVMVRNNSAEIKYIELTTYAEVAMASSASDIMHAGFNKLFCETEILPDCHAILCHHRSDDPGGSHPFLYHAIILPDGYDGVVSYETDRLKFIGRGNTAMDPLAMKTSGKLSDSQGPVLDPVIAIRCRVRIAPGESARFDMLYGIEKDRKACRSMLKKAGDFEFMDRQFSASAKSSRIVLKKLKMDADQLRLFTAMAGSIVYSHPCFRPSSEVLIHNHLTQPSLWKYSISGDYPIVLLMVDNHVNITYIELLLKAHAWWRINGLTADLVILNNDRSDYSRFFRDNIEELIAAGSGTDMKGAKGNVYTLQSVQMIEEDQLLLKAIARIVLTDNAPIQDQVLPLCRETEAPLPAVRPSWFPDIAPPVNALPGELLFANDHGGFAKNGKEYIITTSFDRHTPMPWANVLSNPDFGTIVTESGHSHTWSCNASEYFLTQRNGDAVSDTPGEAFYLRDEEDGKYWSLSCLPAPGTGTYITRHGFGYSIFHHTQDGIETEMKVYTDIKEPVKYTTVKIRNLSGGPRRLSAVGYVEWVLDSCKAKSSLHIYTTLDEVTGAVFSGNRYNQHFPDQISFFDVQHPQKTFTTSRTEFIGRNGSLRRPRAMSAPSLGGQVGAGFDACSVLNVPLSLAAGEEQEIVFILGSGKDSEDARRLIRDFGNAAAAKTAYEGVVAYWRSTLGMVHLHTPDPSLNILVNGWLTYQTISSRLWARSGYYQPGGAFGFRDQLQDVLSVLHIDPLLARRHLLTCAAHQFEEGDVLHWWHPGIEWGTRTNCSDDLLWLPFVICRYIAVTGDKKILDEPVPYISGKRLSIGEESVYGHFTQSAGTDPVYIHCRKAIDYSLKFGIHGLPLMGGSDWNDSMSKVGKDGKGESVWLGFFLYSVLNKFSKIAEQYGDAVYADFCKIKSERLKISIENSAWDGAWYRRAYFDDGTPLGSVSGEECRIDSISQSWSVLSGAAPSKRAHTAMESAYLHLVDKENRLIKLLDPPFNSSKPDPGYIKEYSPGVRENGGQYTHAAIWMIMAYAAMGDQLRCRELLDMINPIKHSDSFEKAEKYMVEPYIIAADVYTAQQQEGRGGWTWYTGAAGWMYQLVIESLIGLTKEGGYLRFDPCLPDTWGAVTVIYKYFTSTYHIIIENVRQPDHTIVVIDDVLQRSNLIGLNDDGKVHRIEISRQSRHIDKYSSLYNSIV